MAQPVEFTQTGVGATDWFLTDIHRNPFNIGFGVEVTGTVTYTVEHTFFKDLYTETPVPAGSIFPHATIANQTASQDGNYAFPVMAVRVNVTAGTGSIKVTFIQAGIRTG